VIDHLKTTHRVLGIIEQFDSGKCKILETSANHILGSLTREKTLKIKD
jgi:hypothetical protein